MDNLISPPKEVSEYIAAAKGHGLTDTVIKQTLLDAGWEREIVESGLKQSASKIPLNQTLTPQMQQGEQSIARPGPQISALQTQTVQPGAGVGEIAVVKKKSHVGLWTFFIIVFLLLGGAAAYAFYAYGYYTPSQVWEKHSLSEWPKIYKTKFTASYNDNSTENSSPNFKNINLKFNGDYYINGADENNTQSSAEVQYTLGSGSTNISTGLKYRQKNKVIYLNVGSNPLLDIWTQALTQGASQDKNLEWLKLDMGELEKAGGMNPEDDLTKFKQVFNPQFTQELEAIWQDSKVIKVKKTLGLSRINGVLTLHFENELDKEALRDVLNSSISKIVNALAEIDQSDELKVPSPSELDTARYFVSGLVNKIEIKKFETWVGPKDLRLHKIELESNMPSLLGLINQGIDSPIGLSGQNSKDDLRIADMNKIAGALEVFYDDNGGYPEGKEGIPIGLAPTYIEKIPSTQKPAEGQCSDYYNTYWHLPKGEKKVKNGKTVYTSFQYDFCLGSRFGSYNSGIAKLTPEGIISGLPCQDTQERCLSTAGGTSQEESDRKAIDDFLSKLQFTAEFSLSGEYSDFNLIRTIDEPREFFDLTSIMLSTQASLRDSQRLTDMLKLASALELYRQDKNLYPKSLANLYPNYIAALPTPPLPQDGTCSLADNEYAYKPLANDSRYELVFCLGADMQGYKAGKRILGPSGIK